jgi:hypothetical protein
MLQPRRRQTSPHAIGGRSDAEQRRAASSRIAEKSVSNRWLGPRRYHEPEQDSSYEGRRPSTKVPDSLTRSLYNSLILLMYVQVRDFPVFYSTRWQMETINIHSRFYAQRSRTKGS